MNPWEWLRDNYGLIGWICSLVAGIFLSAMTIYHYQFFKPEMAKMQGSIMQQSRAESNRQNYIFFQFWCQVYDEMSRRNDRQDANYKKTCAKRDYFLNLMQIDYKNGILTNEPNTP